LIAREPDTALDERLLRVHTARGHSDGRIPILNETHVLRIGRAGTECNVAIVHLEVVRHVAFRPVRHDLGHAEGATFGEVVELIVLRDGLTERVEPGEAEVAGHWPRSLPDVRWTAVDEGRHQPTADPSWCERWWFDAWTSDAGTGCYAEIVILPPRQQAWYWAAVVRAGEPLLSVVDLDQPLPLERLRLRAGQLWADHLCEVPWQQWTVVNETYAVALDDADEALGRGLGTPTPVAFDLEWYATADPTPLPRAEGYRQDGEVHGVIELRGGNLHFEGPGRRGHRWGPLDWTTVEGERAEGVRAPIRLDVDGVAMAIEHVLAADGWHRWRHPLEPR
jgi:hypothetical protein